MEDSIFEVSSVIRTANQLREESGDKKILWTDALKLAVEIERNVILKNAFVVQDDNSAPSGLEAIALALGYKQRLT